MNITAEFIVNAIGAIGTFFTGIIAFIGVFKYFKTIKFKEEYCYGEEADKRYKMVKDILKKEHDFDHPYGGGEITVPRFEIKKFVYDPQTMIPEWKNHKKIVRYYYKNSDGVKAVKGWRLS